MRAKRKADLHSNRRRCRRLSLSRELGDGRFQRAGGNWHGPGGGGRQAFGVNRTTITWQRRDGTAQPPRPGRDSPALGPRRARKEERGLSSCRRESKQPSGEKRVRGPVCFGRSPLLCPE